MVKGNGKGWHGDPKGHSDARIKGLIEKNEKLQGNIQSDNKELRKTRANRKRGVLMIDKDIDEAAKNKIETDREEKKELKRLIKEYSRKSSTEENRDKFKEEYDDTTYIAEMNNKNADRFIKNSGIEYNNNYQAHGVDELIIKEDIATAKRQIRENKVEIKKLKS
jgi:hypothetical protein